MVADQGTLGKCAVCVSILRAWSPVPSDRTRPADGSAASRQVSRNANIYVAHHGRADIYKRCRAATRQTADAGLARGRRQAASIESVAERQGGNARRAAICAASKARLVRQRAQT